MWDSAVRAALHQAAQDAGCDFEGLGPHTMRRANISWRQAVGGSAIEASKIAGHTQLDTTMEYTFVALERQQETTRAIQKELRKAARAKRAKKAKQAKQVTAKPKKSPEPQLPPPPPLALPVPPVEQMPVVSTQVM
jgi:integrase